MVLRLLQSLIVGLDLRELVEILHVILQELGAPILFAEHGRPGTDSSRRHALECRQVPQDKGLRGGSEQENDPIIVQESSQ